MTTEQIKILLEEMMEDEECYGYKEHKTLTLNTIYGYPLEDVSKSPTMKKLKDFAMENYRNGWLQAITIINDKLKESK